MTAKKRASICGARFFCVRVFMDKGFQKSYNQKMSFLQTFSKKLNTALHRGFKKNCEVAADHYRLLMYKKFGLYKKYMLPEYEWDNNLLVFNEKKMQELKFAGKIAVQAHIFYPELAEEIAQNVNCIPCDFDIYASTDSEEKAAAIRKVFDEKCKAKKILVQVFENRGRDVLPFLRQLRPVIADYDIFCHIHSKRTMTVENFHYGECWRKYLYRHLFGTKENVTQILNAFAQKKDCAMIFPETYPLTEMGVYGLAYKFPRLRFLAKHYGIKIKKLDIVKDYSPGTMFWARSEAFRNFIQDDWYYKYFKKEFGAENYAFEHSVERIWPFLASSKGWTFQRTFNNCQSNFIKDDKKRLAVFACKDFDSSQKQNDQKYIKALEALGCQTICANCDAGEDYFDAYKKALGAFGFDKLQAYDQVILADNSCLPPIFPLENVFERVKDLKKDFWGLTMLPEENGRPEFIQSYFLVFENAILKDSAFEEFWTSNETSEIKLTEFFKKKFTCACAFEEVKNSKEFLNNYSDCPLRRPHELLLLGSPLIKKEFELSDKGKEQVNRLIEKLIPR